MTKEKKPPEKQLSPGTHNDEGADLWSAYKKTVKPLKRTRPYPVERQPHKTAGSAEKHYDSESLPVGEGLPFGRQERPNTTERSLVYKSRRRLKRPLVEKTLDLHGYKQVQAYKRLHIFIAQAAREGIRCVLVITGKGTFSKAHYGQPADGGEERPVGILRQNVPVWLHERFFRALVSKIAPAHPQDGGSGAIYVFLKREKG